MKQITKRMMALLLLLTMVIGLFPVVSISATELPPELDLITAEEDALIESDVLSDIDQFFARTAKRSNEMTLADYVEATDDVMELVIASETYVEGSIVERGDGFFWQTTTGITCGYFPEDRYKADQMTTTKSVDTSKLATWDYAAATTNDVCLVGPMYSSDDDFTAQYTNEALNIAKAMGGTAYGLIDSQANVDTIAQAIEKCGVVIFDSHGGTDYQIFYGGSDGEGTADNTSQAHTSYIWLSSGTGMTNADCAYNTGTYGRYPHAYKDSSGNYFADGTAFANHMRGNSEYCLLWLAICMGMSTDGMCAPLQNKGVDVVYGYSQSVTFYGDYKYEATFWSNMIAGKTVAESINAMKSKHGNWDPAYSSYTQANAVAKYVAFPIVSSNEDPYPGQGKVDALQTVNSTHTLMRRENVTIELEYPLGATSIDAVTGVEIDLPTVSAPEGYTFEGWTKTLITEGTTTKPVIYRETYMPLASCTLYALFSYKADDGGNYTEQYVYTDISDIKSTDEVVITMNYQGTRYAMSSSNGANGAPAGINVTVSDNKLTSTPTANLLWNISASKNEYEIKPSGSTSTWLYCTNTNNGVRVGTGSNKTYQFDGGYFYNIGTNRYMGVYLTGSSWRCYTSTTGNIYNQVTEFYVKNDGIPVYYITDIVIPCPHANQTETYVAPTCLESGSSTMICDDCGVIVSKQTLAPLDHNYQQVSVTKPTCTEQGCEKFACERCGHSYEELSNALGHNYENGICLSCGEADSSITDYSGRYYIAGKRNTDTNYQYIMGVKDGTRYDIEDSGMSELPATITTVEADKVFVIEKNDDGTYRIYAEGITDQSRYLGWTSGNSGTFFAPEDALDLTIDRLESGLYNIHFKASDAERYLSINGTASNTYAAWYKTGQIKDLALIPIDENATTHQHEVIYFEGQPASCYHDGTIAHYYCASEECPNFGVCYMDEELTIEILPEDLIDPATGHNESYTDNHDGTHFYTCLNGCTEGYSESHSYTNGICICGAVEVVEPVYVLDETLIPSISVRAGAEMQVMYTVLHSRIEKFDKFYLVVNKEVYNEDNKEVIYSLESGNLTIKTHPTTGAIVGYNATFTGIYASQMCDQFTATLYAVAPDGTIYYGKPVVNSIQNYLMEQLTSENSNAELKTLVVDMLNYGAAAQIFFEYNASNLANASLSEDQQLLGTQVIPDAIDSSFTSGEGLKISANIALQNKVMLYATCRYGCSEESNMLFIVRDALTGKVLEEIVPFMANEIACQGVYDNVGASQMRQLITIELYDNGELVSETLTWSVESYVAQVRADSASSEALINASNAMLVYGDSVAAYLKATNQ